MSDEEVLQQLFESATDDLHAPKVKVRPRPTVVQMPTQLRPGRSWSRQVLVAGLAAAVGAADTLVGVAGFGPGGTSQSRTAAGSANLGAGVAFAKGSGPAALYRLAATVRALPAPSGRYAVQIEQQTEDSTRYVKASVIDSRTGDTWTYQEGPGVPSVLPMAPGFSPTEAQLRSAYPTDPVKLRAALIAQASASNQSPSAPQTPNDLAVTQAIDTLWDPLVQPALRAALVSVVAAVPGVVTDVHARDARGRPAIEISYEDTSLGMRFSVYLDPRTGVVLENSEEPYAAAADAGLAGSDVYLSQYWTNTPPTVNPLKK